MKSESNLEDRYFDLVYSKNVVEFVTVANEFCHFVESVNEMERADFTGKLQKIFALLYLKTTLLPDMGDNVPEEVPEKFVNEVDYSILLQKVAAKMADMDTYSEVFDDAMRFSEAPVEATISENVADIYQDLKDFVMAYRIGNSELSGAALYECRNNFENYWGQKLVNGLRALHHLVYVTMKTES